MKQQSTKAGRQECGRFTFSLLVGDGLWSRIVCSDLYAPYRPVDGWLRLRVETYVSQLLHEQMRPDAGGLR